ncbi:hypothetical protein EXIGLDRAFT_831912 [Exidia glandulosa HHB12029]|uniref:Uncharacterized protein n=1 Tax=Exidia glandulosa HHB12029 TaxID=1314781 RepID=A0A165M8Q7_EXIGL|nr:hypothetical protein EXIGLDRAFT_831912 [Exidia glandulosa HHB12029]
MSLADFLDEAERNQASSPDDEGYRITHTAVQSSPGAVPLSRLSLSAFHSAVHVPDQDITPIMDLIPSENPQLDSTATVVAADGESAAHEPMSASLADNASHDPVQVLRDLCVKVLGSEDPISFEFAVQGGAHPIWSCSLTIRRPDGAQRSWSSVPGLLMKKLDAKSSAGQVAYDSGAAHFINSEEWVPEAAPDVVAAQSNEKESEDAVVSDEDTEYSLEIASCCKLWLKGNVKPQYIITTNQACDAFGCALRIQLAPHVSRVCCVDILYDSQRAAKAAVAQLAVTTAGILEYIRNGAPGPPRPPVLNGGKEITVSEFYDALPVKVSPKPGFEDIHAGGRAIMWLNQAVITAKGSRVASKWTYINDAKSWLHGAILVITHPTHPQRCYLVDPVFAKRQDAKQAVTLLALSQGLAEYFEEIVKEVDSRLTPEMRKHATDSYQVLTSEYGKQFKDEKGKGAPVPWEYQNEEQAFGCSLEIELPGGSRGSYRVPMEYRNKTDARLACVLKAVEGGVLALFSSPSKALLQSSSSKRDDRHGRRATMPSKDLYPQQQLDYGGGAHQPYYPIPSYTPTPTPAPYYPPPYPAAYRDWPRPEPAPSRRGGDERDWRASTSHSPYQSQLYPSSDAQYARSSHEESARWSSGTARQSHTLPPRPNVDAPKRPAPADKREGANKRPRM